MATYHDTFTEAGRALAQEMAEEIENGGKQAVIATTYRDFGQDWTWENIIAESAIGTFQLLYPAEVRKMNEGERPSNWSEIVGRVI